MPAIPLIIMGVSAGVSAYGAHKQSQAASRAADAQTGLANQQANLSKHILDFANGQVSSSAPALNKAMQYYMTLATGNRGAINSVLAPQRASIMDTYSGAQRGIEARTAQGPQRDVMMGELQRQKAGQLGLMPFMARQQAVGQLANMGERGQQRGLLALTGASGPLNSAGSMYDRALQNQLLGQQAWSEFGSQMFNMFGPYLMDKYGKKDSGMGGI